MKKEERLKQQSILANQINNSMLFEMLPLLKINLYPKIQYKLIQKYGKLLLSIKKRKIVRQHEKVYKMYKSTHELTHTYREALNILSIKYIDTPFLDLSMYNPKDNEQKLMMQVIQIADALELDVGYPEWFHIINDTQPFNSLTPYQYLIKHKTKGLLEILFYVQALAVNTNKWQANLAREAERLTNEIFAEIPPLPRPKNLPESTD